MSAADAIPEHVVSECAQDLLDRIADCFISIDRSWRFAFLNRSAEHYLGSSRATLAQRVIWDAYPEVVGSKLEHTLRTAMDSNQPIEAELLSPLKKRWISVRVFPSPAGLSIYFLDLHLRRQAEERLRATEVRYRSAFENSNEGILLSSPDGQIFAANPSACRMLERTEEEICSIGRGGIFDGGDPRLGAFIAERRRHGRVRKELTMLRGDGSCFPAEVSSTLFRDVNGAMRTTLSFHDITEQKQAEEGTRLLLDAGAALAASLDLESTLRTLGALLVPRFADIVLIDLREDQTLRRVSVAIKGQPTRISLEGDRPALGMTVRATSTVEGVLRSGQGELVPVITGRWLERAFPDPDDLEKARQFGATSAMVVPLQHHGTSLGVLSLVITHGRRHYGDLDLRIAQSVADRAVLALDSARLYAKARQAMELRDQVLGFVSHDLRNPLHTVLLATSRLGEPNANPGLIADIIRRAVGRADRLIEDLLLTAKLEATGIPVDRTKQDVGDLIEDVVALYRPEAEAKAVALSASVDPSATTAWFDRHRMTQLISNLVGNAIKFTPRNGQVRLRAAAADGVLEIAVADSGIGIPPDELPHLFDRFWQGARSKRGGAGLGLAIAKGIAESHQGTVEVESTVGQGTTFTVRLPLQTGAGPSEPRVFDA